ncbi:hypothetical protein O1611_g1344 [Lasiodiplodia mahajangana]|uniref:Uncharacterized protein n=1 Tax=Lasiodiplodia mahajangana TaxID=1108764 RepID=A0ACC2JXY7_9PEZI|nr:hypothetical protein O1611_g1344 [Lasiodiplodia mahajangana]
MVNRALLVSVVTFLSLTTCSPAQAPSVIEACKPDVTSLSWKITDFEWRTGYYVWSYYIGVGPAPPPPPTQFYNCGEAMLRMNITRVDAITDANAGEASAQDQVIPCVEQTNDAKLANITDMKDYNAGPWGPPPPSPHWFTCDMSNQLFIYPNGTVDPWADANRLLGNVTTKIRMDPEKMTIEIGQSWACGDDGGSEGQVEVTGIAALPPLTCRGRPSLESDMNFLMNSPVMHGPGMNAPVRNGSVCTGSEFLVKARTPS